MGNLSGCSLGCRQFCGVYRLISVETLDFVALLLSVVFLGYAACSDLRTREVSDWVWLVYFPVALIILGFRLYLDPKLLVMSLISIIATSALSLLIFKFGIFGGADAKALICLGLALPTYPSCSRLLLSSINPAFPLVVLYNGYLFSLSTIVYCLIKNLDWRCLKGRDLFTGFVGLSTLKKAAALLTGFRTDFSTLRKTVYLYPMEEVSKGDGVCRSIKFFTDAEVDRDDLVRTLGVSVDDKEEVWVSPGIPLLFFIWIALLSSSFLGDVLFGLIFQAQSQTLLR